jgi:putative DNA primase/helicase
MKTTDLNCVREALSCVPADDRDTWVRMGMAIKSEFGDAGFDFWDEWSQRSDSYKAHDARDVWKSIDANGTLKIGTLFHEAKANGWNAGGTDQRCRVDKPATPSTKVAQPAQEDAKLAREREQAAKKAAEMWKAATEARPDHPYLVRKGVSPVATLREIEAGIAVKILGYTPKSSGEALSGRLLVAPVKVGDRLSTCELIDAYGRKTALAGRGTKTGGHWAAQPLPEGEGDGLTLLLGEGVATVLSAKAASGHAAIAALSSGNLPTVAKAMRKRYPKAGLVILADLVKATGQADPHAGEAARAVDGLLAIPDFGTDRADGATDFNDMAARCEAEAVRQCIQSAEPVAKVATVAVPNGNWPEPQPLTVTLDHAPYPLDALPDKIQAAVKEVLGFTQAPVALVASSALATLSLAIQPHVDVKRAERLTGPVSSSLLIIADSGERKSTCDNFFTAALRDYEVAQAIAAQPEVQAYKAAMEAWEAKRSGIKDKIRKLAKNQESTEEMEQALRELHDEKPVKPRVPRLFYTDVTPEALARGLATDWPSAGVVSAEAGNVFGAHGMGKDSIMRNLALLNVLWDGGAVTIDRVTAESFTLHGARLTVALQVQEATLRSFFDRSGGLARGTGFLSRFLVAWPESTQGFRPFTEPPENWPALAEFNRCIAAILDEPPPIDEKGALKPLLLPLTEDAKAAWVDFHDAIEGELASGGELYDVRDVASKSADNAARLAALFQVFANGTSEPIGAEVFESASRIAAWHLHEARRFFGELALPAELADAARLDRWLIEYCRRQGTYVVSRRDVQRHVTPVHLRQKAALDDALRELIGAGRLRVVSEGRRKEIHVNPALLDGGEV